MAPVMSVAMPILIGPGRMRPCRRQQPAAGEPADPAGGGQGAGPAQEATACAMVAGSLSSSVFYMAEPPLVMKPCGRSLTIASAMHEDQRVGQHRRHHPGQPGGQAADRRGAQHRALEGADAAEHDREEGLHQEARCRYRPRAGRAARSARRPARPARRRRRRSARRAGRSRCRRPAPASGSPARRAPAGRSRCASATASAAGDDHQRGDDDEAAPAREFEAADT